MRSTPLIAICLLTFPGPLAAQGGWTLSLERGFTTYSEAVHDTSTPPVRLIPWHLGTYSVRVSHDGGRSGFSVALTVANGQMGATVGDVAILPGSGLLLLEAAPELRVRISAASSAAVRPGNGAIPLSLPGMSTVAKTTPSCCHRAFSTNSPPWLISGIGCAPRLRLGFAKKICRIRARRSSGAYPPEPPSQQSVHSLSPGV